MGTVRNSTGDTASGLLNAGYRGPARGLRDEREHWLENVSPLKRRGKVSELPKVTKECPSPACIPCFHEVPC